MKPMHSFPVFTFVAVASLASLASLGSIGCGGSSGTGGLGATGDGGAGGQDGGGDPGDGGVTPPLADGGPQHDAAGNGDAGTDGGPKLAPIDPIVVGNAWTFDVTQVGVYPYCATGSHQAKVLGSAQRDGKLAYETQSFCTGLGSVYYAVDGDVVYWDDAATWVLVLDAPVVEGHTWSNGVTSYAWHDVGAVTVPAGTFSSCWKAQDTAGPSYTIFCRGVGPVHWSYRDATGSNGYEALLTAKNF